jgi:hypothetical protein
MKKSNIIAVACTGLLLVLAIKIGVSFNRFSTVEQGFAAIQPGQSRALVAGRLGVPNYHAGNCTTYFDPPQNCALEYAYSHPFAPLLPDYYLVWFSAEGTVISAERRTSP